MNSTILYKYFNGEATEEETTLIFEWIDDSPQNKRQFIKLKTAFAYSTSAEVDQPELDRRRSSIKLGKKQFRPWRYAAIFVLLIASGIYYYSSQNKTSITEQQPLVLQLEDASETINIEQVTQIKTKEGIHLANFSDNQLTYIEQPKSDASVKQFISVPYGKTLKIQLPDSSIVILNAGSTLEFPSRFDTSKRQVTLTGEGFFDVTKNPSQPFIVLAKNLNVEVLGTRFNVQAYPEDRVVETALEEGSVSLSSASEPNKNLLLIPGELATYMINSGVLTKKTDNIQQKTAWTRGELLLDNTAFTDILKTLERHYNIKTVNQYPELEQESFSGTVKLNLGIEQTLQLLKLDTDFDFTLNNNQLILRRPSNTNP